MKKYLLYFKNKFILTLTIFGIYFLFLDDTDIFSIVGHEIKLRNLKESKLETKEKLDSTTNLLKQLKYSSEIEKFAREKKMFKKDDEDVFVISYQ